MSFNAKCKVNSDGSVCLEDILNSFNSPIKEEHAWALCYQCVKYYNECISSRRPHIYSVHEVRHVYLKTDGNIHENTNNKVRDEARKLARGDKELIAGLGVAMYMALDRGSQKNEERVISQDLEELINYMVSDDLSHSTEQTHHETDDEGIEQDAEDVEEPGTSKTRTHTILRGVLKRCEAHLNLTKDKSEAHYKAVLRALVAEALELSMFLEKVAQGSIVLPNASSEDTVVCWTKFWDQVMMDLRMGVKLKKAPPCRAHIEYELTPYEILMKDIRTCKYSLRKIMVNGDVPSRVTKDAHAIIMEFIRSRPPLKKASERKLPAPALREFTPREQLLDSIKKGRKLRPTARKQPEPKKLDAIETGSNTKRRLIKVDVSQFEKYDDDDDESDDSPDVDDGGEWSSMESLRTNALDLATSQDMHSRVSAGKSAWCKIKQGLVEGAKYCVYLVLNILGTSLLRRNIHQTNPTNLESTIQYKFERRNSTFPPAQWSSEIECHQAQKVRAWACLGKLLVCVLQVLGCIALIVLNILIIFRVTVRNDFYKQGKVLRNECTLENPNS